MIFFCKINRWFLMLLATAMLPYACKTEPESISLPDAAEIQEAFMESNMYLLALEEEAINDFIDRYGWNMTETGSGLRYKITHEGSGEKPVFGDFVDIAYTIYLITGDPVYSSGSHGLKTFTVGRGGVERGLEEAILKLNEGSRAILIMPHHLAHGVPGDGKMIPKRATIIYEIELMNVY
ncbi:MAG: peptidylprolyl isomerase [Bacteroidia bacterium]|nr:MAG: peptidylprolyl isomerase [Bacteroidia bacterium]